MTETSVFWLVDQRCCVVVEGGDDEETGIPMTKEDFLVRAVNKIQDEGLERKARRK